jgi:predicted MFS family arabinose efflux permease
MKAGRERIRLFFAACYLAQGMSGLVYEPLSYELKDRLSLGPAASAAFIWWMTLPLLLKPLFGLLTDLLPIAGRRRRPHMLLGAGLWAAALACLAAVPPPGYGPLLGLLVAVNCGLVLCDCVCDAVMVEQGKSEGLTGLYQAVQIGTLYGTIVITGAGGGWLAAHASARSVYALSAVFPLLALASIAWLREPSAPPPPRAGAGALLALLGSRRFWLVSGLIFLWSFQPFLGTAQFYYESQTLGLSAQAIGWLGTLGGLAGALGAAAYGRLSRGSALGARLKLAVAAGVPLSLLYLLFMGGPSAAFVTAVTAFVGVGFRLALMELAARSCPEGGEAAAFAAYMSVFNLAAAGSNLAGGKLLEALRPRLPEYGCLAALVGVGALCVAACWPLLGPILRELGDDAPGAQVA